MVFVIEGLKITKKTSKQKATKTKLKSTILKVICNSSFSADTYTPGIAKLFKIQLVDSHQIRPKVKSDAGNTRPI